MNATFNKVHLDRGFELGQTVQTVAAGAELDPVSVLACLQRHAAGDWGDRGDANGQIDDHDWNANQAALRDGDRLVSIYRDSAGTKFYIITAAKDDNGRREATTVMLPADA